MSSGSKHPKAIIKEGYVTKQGGRIKTWKKRLCVLDDTCISYYKLQPNPAQKYSLQQGQIELSEVSQVDALEEKEKIKKRFCFKIVTPARVFIIDAETEDNMKSWIQTIKSTKDQPKDKKKKESKKAGDPYEGKSVSELETQLSNLDTKMKTEITEFIKAVEDEMEAILDELCAREIIKVRDSYDPQRLEILKELKRREELKQ